MIITYVASDKIIEGREAGVSYTFESHISNYDYKTKKNKKYIESLTGYPQTMNYGNVDEISISTIEIGGALEQLADECFSSILDGQRFVVDALGNSQQASNEIYTCVMKKDSFRKRRIAKTDMFTYSISARVIR